MKRLLTSVALAAVLALSACAEMPTQQRLVAAGGGGGGGVPSGYSTTQTKTGPDGSVNLNPGESLPEWGGPISGPPSPAPEQGGSFSSEPSAPTTTPQEPTKSPGAPTSDGTGLTEGGNTAPSLF